MRWNCKYCFFFNQISFVQALLLIFYLFIKELSHPKKNTTRNYVSRSGSTLKVLTVRVFINHASKYIYLYKKQLLCIEVDCWCSKLYIASVVAKFDSLLLIKSSWSTHILKFLDPRRKQNYAFNIYFFKKKTCGELY